MDRRSAAAAATFFHGIGAGALLLCLLVCGSSALAQPVTMTAALELSQTYRPNAWQPVRVEFRNPSDRAVDGTALLPLTSSSSSSSSPLNSSPAVMKLPVHLPPDSLVRATLWAYFPRLELNAPKKKQQPSDVPPLTVAELRDSGDAIIARTPVMGLPLSARAGTQADEENGQMILVVSQRAAESSDAPHDIDALLTHVGDRAAVPLLAADMTPDALPELPQALRPVAAVVLDDLDPDALDTNQRQALLEYVRGGGSVVVAAPSADHTAGSWLAPLMPVRTIGSRVADRIDVTADASLKLREALPIVEAVESGGDGAEVMLRGKDYVHVAARPLGMGRVIFTSFPVNALDDSQPRAVALWEDLLAVRRPRWEWSRTRLGEGRFDLLGSMIGRKVAPWGVAAGVTIGYVAVILVAQMLFLGARRPRAFAVSLGVAVMLSAVLVTMGMARRGERALQSARLAILDISGNAPGEQTESLALIGAEEPNLNLESSSERVIVRPARADPRDPAQLSQQPFAVPKAGSYAERIERIWEATGPADPTLRLAAVARFGAGGLTLELDNRLGQPFASPLLVCGRRALTLADVPTGKSSAATLHINERGDFTGASAVLASELSKRRAAMVEASLTPASPTQMSLAAWTDTSPQLIGWLDADGADLLHPGGNRAVEPKSMVMARTRVRIEPPAVGTSVSVPSVLVSANFGKLPYDPVADETVPSIQDGQWLIGFACPPSLGQMRPTRATLELRVSLPGHALSVRKEQCGGGGGSPEVNGFVEPVANWERAVGARKATIDLGPRDIDGAGRVWLLLDVRSVAAAGGDTAAVSWQVKDIGVSIDGQVVAPPVWNLNDEKAK